jgi:hypothetical protein
MHEKSMVNEYETVYVPWNSDISFGLVCPKAVKNSIAREKFSVKKKENNK